MDSDCIFYGTFGFFWLTFLWEQYLCIRQYRKHRDTQHRPPEVLDLIDEETFKKSRSYRLDKELFNFVAGLWGQLESTVVLLCGLLPIFWKISGHFIAQFGYDRTYEVTQSCSFVVLTGLMTFVLEMPWKLYSTFVIEEKHGFNNQTLAFFFKDQVKKLLLSMVLGIPIMVGAIWIIKIGGAYFFLYLWIFVSVVLLFLMTVYPEFIAPLFDKYSPVPDGALREKIEALAQSLHFPLKKLYIVEGSKRSAHSNAYLYGFWNNKRIVLYDTLLENQPNKSTTESHAPDSTEKDTSEAEQLEKKNAMETADENNTKNDGMKKAATKKGCNDDEIVAILGHELGHWKLRHNMCNIIISEVNMFLCFAVFAMLYTRKDIYAAFGFTDSQPTLIGLLIIFQFIFAPYDQVLSFIMTAMSRRMEFSADQFSAKLGYARLLSSALIKLSRDNLSFPVDDWLYSTWHYSHPPTVERVGALKKHE